MATPVSYGNVLVKIVELLIKIIGKVLFFLFFSVICLTDPSDGIGFSSR
jgi:hypothetical protein